MNTPELLSKKVDSSMSVYSKQGTTMKKRSGFMNLVEYAHDRTSDLHNKSYNDAISGIIPRQEETIMTLEPWLKQQFSLYGG